MATRRCPEVGLLFGCLLSGPLEKKFCGVSAGFPAIESCIHRGYHKVFSMRELEVHFLK
jgi:hypothetical protein